MTFRSGHQNFKPDAAPQYLRRYICTDGSCPTCEGLKPGEDAPPHDASVRCESGRRNHCSCDVCF